MPRLRVLICGAGIAGNALSFWLAKFDHLFDVTIVERFPSLRTSGLQVDLRDHGIAAIRRMGLEATVRSKCVPEIGLQLVDTKGIRWGYMPANKSGSGVQAFTSEFEIMRGDLCQIFYDHAKGNVRYKFGISVTSYREIDGDGSPIQADFTDGTSGEYDLLVGADGLFSQTRKLMLGPEGENPLHLLQQHIAYLRVPVAMDEGEEYNATAYIGTRGRFMMTRRHNSQQLQVYLTGQHITKRLQDVPQGDVATQKEVFASEFRGAGWTADEIVDLLLESDDFYCQREAFVKLDPWSRGNVTTLGDSGYCSSTNGYGTSCAVVGAYILAGELVRHVEQADEARPYYGKCVKDALSAYEQKLRPLIDLLQRGLKDDDGSSGFELKNWHIPVILWLAWLASILRVYKVLGLFSDHGVRDWRMPDYPELEEKVEAATSKA